MTMLRVMSVGRSLYGKRGREGVMGLADRLLNRSRAFSVWSPCCLSRHASRVGVPTTCAQAGEGLAVEGCLRGWLGHLAGPVRACQLTAVTL